MQIASNISLELVSYAFSSSAILIWELKKASPPLVKCAQLAFSSKLLTISGKSQRKYQSTTSIGLTVLGIIGVARKEGREERIPGRPVAPVRENCLVFHLSRRRTVGGEGGREECHGLPQKSSHKRKYKERGREGRVEQS